jgi:DNA-binding transcriptional LysR family regulator
VVTRFYHARGLSFFSLRAYSGLEAALAAQGVSLQAFYEVQRSSTAVGLVAEGVAAAVVPSLAIQRGAYPRLKVIVLTTPVVSRSLVLVFRRSAHLSPAAQALFDLIRRSTPRAG